MGDLISRQAAIDALKEHRELYCDNTPNTFSKLPYGEKCRVDELDTAIATLANLPSAQPDRLTDDDFETIRIHLNAHKEALCNQHRWEEAEEYQRIIDRFMGFASQPTIKPRKGKWIYSREYGTVKVWTCSECGWNDIGEWNFCSNCGANMREETNETDGTRDEGR